MTVKRVANSTFGGTLLAISAVDDRARRGAPTFYELVEGRTRGVDRRGGYMNRFEAIDELRLSEGGRVELSRAEIRRPMIG
jgi:hypothetical protein